MFKSGNIIGEVISHHDNLVDVNYGGTVLTLPESENELPTEKMLPVTKKMLPGNISRNMQDEQQKLFAKGGPTGTGDLFADQSSKEEDQSDKEISEKNDYVPETFKISKFITTPNKFVELSKETILTREEAQKYIEKYPPWASDENANKYQLSVSHPFIETEIGRIKTKDFKEIKFIVGKGENKKIKFSKSFIQRMETEANSILEDLREGRDIAATLGGHGHDSDRDDVKKWFKENRNIDLDKVEQEYAEPNALPAWTWDSIRGMTSYADESEMDSVYRKFHVGKRPTAKELLEKNNHLSDFLERMEMPEELQKVIDEKEEQLKILKKTLSYTKGKQAREAFKENIKTLTLEIEELSKAWQTDVLMFQRDLLATFLHRAVFLGMTGNKDEILTQEDYIAISESVEGMINGRTMESYYTDLKPKAAMDMLIKDAVGESREESSESELDEIEKTLSAGVPHRKNRGVLNIIEWLRSGENPNDEQNTEIVIDELRRLIAQYEPLMKELKDKPSDVLEHEAIKFSIAEYNAAKKLLLLWNSKAGMIPAQTGITPASANEFSDINASGRFVISKGENGIYSILDQQVPKEVNIRGVRDAKELRRKLKAYIKQNPDMPPPAEDEKYVTPKFIPDSPQQSAGIVILYRDKILLLHPSNGPWYESYSIPKGQVEPGESNMQAAIRETFEETGITIIPEQLKEVKGKQIEHKNASGKVDKILVYAVMRIGALSDIGLPELKESKSGTIPLDKTNLQHEEVDWGGFVPIDDAKERMLKYQLPILEAVAENVVAGNHDGAPKIKWKKVKDFPGSTETEETTHFKWLEVQVANLGKTMEYALSIIPNDKHYGGAFQQWSYPSLQAAKDDAEAQVEKYIRESEKTSPKAPATHKKTIADFQVDDVVEKDKQRYRILGNRFGLLIGNIELLNIETNDISEWDAQKSSGFARAENPVSNKILYDYDKPIKTAKDAAIRFLATSVLRGTSLTDILKSTMGSSVRGRTYAEMKNKQIIITKLNGKEINERFSPKKIYDEIKSTYEMDIKPRSPFSTYWYGEKAMRLHDLSKEQTPPALSDVESTAKALEGVANKNPDATNSLAEKTGVFFHGSDRSIKEFDPNMMSMDYGHYLSINPSVSEGYGDVLHVINIKGGLKDYLNMEAKASKSDLKKLGLAEGLNVTGEEALIKSRNESGSKLSLEKYAESKGFKGEHYPSQKQITAFDSKALEVKKSGEFKKIVSESIAEAYHKAKQDGSNPELVKAVESLLSKEQAKAETKTLKDAVTKAGEVPDAPKVGEMVMIDTTIVYHADNPKESEYAYGELAVIKDIDLTKAEHQITAQIVSAENYDGSFTLKDGILYGNIVVFDSDEMQWYIPGVTNEQRPITFEEWKKKVQRMNNPNPYIAVLNAILSSKPIEQSELDEKEEKFFYKIKELFGNIYATPSKVISNKTQLENIGKSFGITRQQTMKEITELAIVEHCRAIVLSYLAHGEQSDLGLKTSFEKIVEFYSYQVNLSHRTSTSVLLQQYSTPAPIAFLACAYMDAYKEGQFDSRNPIYFEPSAGNGMLTIGATNKVFVVNEIDETRLVNLQMQDFKAVLRMDASKPFTMLEKKFDGVITNPPFEAMREPVEYGRMKIKALDHLMAIYALETMKDNGRCSIIVGGHTAYDELGRIQAGKNRIFISYLFKHFNVEDIININGDLYSKMGTSFNVRLILINGRKETPEGYPPLKDDKLGETDNGSSVIVNSFPHLYERISKLIL